MSEGIKGLNPSILRERMKHEANALADALEDEARALRSAQFSPHARAKGVRAMVEVGADEALTSLEDARKAVEHHGERLSAYAAMGGYPLGRLGEALGLTGTGMSVRLAQTDVLAPFAKGTRITRRDIYVAYASLSSNETGEDIPS